MLISCQNKLQSAMVIHILIVPDILIICVIVVPVILVIRILVVPIILVWVIPVVLVILCVLHCREYHILMMRFGLKW